MRKGFSVIEVMASLFIGSLIAGILFQTLFQINKVFARVVAISSVERKVNLVQQQFETDFSGIFAPSVQPVEKKEGGADEKATPGKPATPPKPEPKKDEKEKEDPSLKTFLFESDAAGLIKILTFITTNPLAVYNQSDSRAVRVAYRLVADTEDLGTLVLQRQQSEEFVIEKFEASLKKEVSKDGQSFVRTYEVIRGIESMKCEFWVEKIPAPEDKKEKPAPGAAPDAAEKSKEKKEDKKNDAKGKKEERVFVLLEDWIKLSKEEKKKFEAQEVPLFAHITLVMRDEVKRVHSYEFWFGSAGAQGAIVTQKKSKEEAKATEGAKPGPSKNPDVASIREAISSLKGQK